MKKIILLSVLFGLLTNSALATYYKTYTYNCNENAMAAKLDRATVDHRAVVTEVVCAKNHAMHHENRYAGVRFAQPKIEQVATSEVFVRPAKRAEYIEYKPVRHVKYVRKPVITPCIQKVFIASVETATECDTCCDCQEPVEQIQPVVVSVKPVAPVVEPVAIEDEDDEIVQCEKYGKCAS